MTTAYAQQPPIFGDRPPTPVCRLRLVSPAPGQGREALKVRDNVRGIGIDTRQGHSAEAEALAAIFRDLTESMGALRDRPQDAEVTIYNHVPLKTAFSVTVTYKRMGKMPPRQLPEVD